MKLYVGNLPYNISDDQLEAMFTKFGQPDSARVITDRDTGQSKGFGFLEMPESGEAEAAVNNLNGRDLMGRKINVNEARPRENRPAGGGQRAYGGGGERW